MKFSLQTVTFAVFVIAFGTLSGDFFSRSPLTRPYLFAVVSAEDEGEDHDREDYKKEKEREDDDKYEKAAPVAATETVAAPVTSAVEPVKTKQVVQEVTTYTPVTRTVDVTDAEYVTDTDGDLLVDAVDPNPLVKQSEYFTDTDGDGVPNALDRHHDEDDFAYFEDLEVDENADGVFDSYQQ